VLAAPVVGGACAERMAAGDAAQAEWLCEQAALQARVVQRDELDFEPGGFEGLRLIGGMDVSWCKRDATRACATLVVLEYPSMRVVHEETRLATITLPYIPGFLAFRECPPLLEMLSALRDSHPHLFPQVVFMDGNGVLHPRGCGIACHLGVLANVVTIGVAKTFMNVDGMTKAGVQQAALALRNSGEWFQLRGASGRVWGGAILARDAGQGRRERARIRDLKRTATPRSGGALAMAAQATRALDACSAEAAVPLKRIDVGELAEWGDSAAASGRRQCGDSAAEGDSGAEARRPPSQGGQRESCAAEGEHAERRAEARAACGTGGGGAGGGSGGSPVFVSVGHRISVRIYIYIYIYIYVYIYYYSYT